MLGCSDLTTAGYHTGIVAPDLKQHHNQKSISYPMVCSGQETVWWLHSYAFKSGTTNPAKKGGYPAEPLNPGLSAEYVFHYHKGLFGIHGSMGGAPGKIAGN